MVPLSQDFRSFGEHNPTGTILTEGWTAAELNKIALSQMIRNPSGICLIDKPTIDTQKGLPEPLSDSPIESIHLGENKTPDFSKCIDRYFLLFFFLGPRMNASVF
jgi:hypothetical protein